MAGRDPGIPNTLLQTACSSRRHTQPPQEASPLPHKPRLWQHNAPASINKPRCQQRHRFCLPLAAGLCRSPSRPYPRRSPPAPPWQRLPPRRHGDPCLSGPLAMAAPGGTGPGGPRGAAAEEGRGRRPGVGCQARPSRLPPALASSCGLHGGCSEQSEIKHG